MRSINDIWFNLVGRKKIHKFVTEIAEEHGYTVTRNDSTYGNYMKHKFMYKITDEKTQSGTFVELDEWFEDKERAFDIIVGKVKGPSKSREGWFKCSFVYTYRIVTEQQVMDKTLWNLIFGTAKLKDIKKIYGFIDLSKNSEQRESDREFEHAR